MCYQLLHFSRMVMCWLRVQVDLYFEHRRDEIASGVVRHIALILSAWFVL